MMRRLDRDVVALFAKSELDSRLFGARPGDNAIEHHFLRRDPHYDRVTGCEQRSDGPYAAAAVADILDNAGNITWLRMNQSGPMAVQPLGAPLFANPDFGVAKTSEQLVHFTLGQLLAFVHSGNSRDKQQFKIEPFALILSFPIHF